MSGGSSAPSITTPDCLIDFQMNDEHTAGKVFAPHLAQSGAVVVNPMVGSVKQKIGSVPCLPGRLRICDALQLKSRGILLIKRIRLHHHRGLQLRAHSSSVRRPLQRAEVYLPMFGSVSGSTYLAEWSSGVDCVLHRLSDDPRPSVLQNIRADSARPFKSCRKGHLSHTVLISRAMGDLVAIARHNP